MFCLWLSQQYCFVFFRGWSTRRRQTECCNRRVYQNYKSLGLYLSLIYNKRRRFEATLGKRRRRTHFGIASLPAIKCVRMFKLPNRLEKFIKFNQLRTEAKQKKITQWRYGKVFLLLVVSSSLARNFSSSDKKGFGQRRNRFFSHKKFVSNKDGNM